MTNPHRPRPERPPPPIDELTELLVRCHRYCDTHGGNLPDLLSAALTEAGHQLGGSYALIRHGPGNWEATHVQALAAGADHHSHLDADVGSERPY